MFNGALRSTTTFVCGLGAVALLGLAGPAAAEPDAKIQRTWKAKCASCHGADGKGATEMGKKLAIPDMTAADWQKKTGDDLIKKAINDGIKREGKAEGMDSFKEKLTPEQIDGLAALVRGLK